MKSFKPKGGPDDDSGNGGCNGDRDFKGEKRSNTTHASTTDADARLYRKGNTKESRLCYLGHALMENRQGLAVGGALLWRRARRSATKPWTWWIPTVLWISSAVSADYPGWGQGL